jgi:hypothetical protein
MRSSRRPTNREARPCLTARRATDSRPARLNQKRHAHEPARHEPGRLIIVPQGTIFERLYRDSAASMFQPLNADQSRTYIGEHMLAPTSSPSRASSQLAPGAR